MARQAVDGALPVPGEPAQGRAVQRAAAAPANGVGIPVRGAAMRRETEQAVPVLAVRCSWRRLAGAGCGRPVQPGEECAVVARAFLRVAEHRVGLVDDGGVPVVAAEIRVGLQPLHQRAVARADDLRRRAGLDLQNAVVIAPVLHASASLAQAGRRILWRPSRFSGPLTGGARLMVGLGLVEGEAKPARADAAGDEVRAGRGDEYADEPEEMRQYPGERCVHHDGARQ